jgi:transcriptional regulator with XRE-family HTH domain
LVRQARKKEKFTPDEMSTLSGVTVAELRNVELGRRTASASMIAKIVHTLPVSPELGVYQRRYPRAIEKSAEVMDRIPGLLRTAREDAGLSRRELARRSGVDAMYVSRLERGLVPAADWRRISAIAAQVPLSELAKLTTVSGAGMLKHSALASAGDLEKLLVSLPSSTFKDKEWGAAVRARLKKCIETLEIDKA